MFVLASLIAKPQIVLHLSQQPPFKLWRYFHAWLASLYALLNDPLTIGAPADENLAELATLALYESEISNWAAEDEGGAGVGDDEKEDAWFDSGAGDDVVGELIVGTWVLVEGKEGGGVGGIWQWVANIKMMSNSVLIINVYILSDLEFINH